MTAFERLYTALSKTGIPVTHMCWPKGNVPTLPFVVYLRDDDETVFADDIRFCEMSEYRIELYEESRDPHIEQAVEAALSQFGPYTRETTTWIDRENCQLTVYKIDLIEGDK